ncbi:hypothetical protein SCUCBS95973_006711 [Sporothrix curviconia]|uniref:Uncharacterized protein n=1 Tax=Sporothrix curviconia TaxID=1260050 RepID=A0ABP0C7Q3_9PEZI
MPPHARQEAETLPQPPIQPWATNPDAKLPERLRRLRPMKMDHDVPVFPDDKLASNGGHGTMEALALSRDLEDNAGIPNCFCGVSALIYYGAGRMRDDWWIAVPADLLDRAEAHVRTRVDDGTYMSVLPWPYAQPGCLAHTLPRYKTVGIGFYFTLFPDKYFHIDCSVPANLERSANGLPYPTLAALLQSCLETYDRVSLADAVDGSDVSDEWGQAHLYLDGTIDLDWARWKNERMAEAEARGFPVMGRATTARFEKRALWDLMVTNKGGRRGWTQPPELFATRFRLHNSPDPSKRLRISC